MRTCCGSAASTRSRSFAWLSSPFGRPTTRAGSSSGTATKRPLRSAPIRSAQCPWLRKRKSVSQIRGPVHMADLVPQDGSEFGVVAGHQLHHALERPDMAAGQGEGVDLLAVEDDEVPPMGRD